MLSKIQFEALLKAEGSLVIDGALATELEARGHDLNHALWSAKVLRDDPASIERVHYDYYMAGAHIAITASYQASTAGLYDHFGMNESAARAMIVRSVQIARKARDSALKKGIDRDRPLLIAGSVGPYGSYLADGSEYRGDYERTIGEFKDFHRPRIEALVDAGSDLLALETMPNFKEIKALLELLQEDFPAVIVWLSCTSKDSGHLSDGTPWSDVLALINGYVNAVIGFGINCVPFATAWQTLKNISDLTELPLVCYPNSGEIWDAKTKTWSGGSSSDYSNAQAVSSWTKNGARLVGGCCRTGPAYIDEVARHLGHSDLAR